MSNIVKLNIPQKFTAEMDMRNAVYEAIHKFDDQVSLATAIGILEIVKEELMKESE